MLHPYVSGNKFRKLKYNIQKAKDEKFKQILSFGGAYSNHIYSLAAAGKIHNIPTIGIIRGEEHTPLNDTLQFATDCGMKLIYISREAYRNKSNPECLAQLQTEYPNAFIVPEGGSNTLGVKGCEEIISEIDVDFDYICTGVGSGGTISGIINSLQGNKIILGFPAIKNADYLKTDISQFLKEDYQNWGFISNYHFGGFAKMKPKLLDFIQSFKKNHDVLLDPLYTGKMIFGIFDLIQKDYFPLNTTIVAIHTGGLQGWNGIDPSMLL